MKRTVLLVAVMLVIASCAQIQQLTNLVSCQFRVSTVDNVNLAGVNVEKIKSYSDLNLSDGIKLLGAAAQGTLPLSLTVNVEAKNPNAQMAALNKLDWILLIDDVQMATGSTTQRVEVPPNGTGIFPIQVTSDLAQVLKGQSAQNIVNFGLNLAGYGSRPTRITVKAKPTILIGSTAIMYPGYINIKSEFGGN
jgi:LEA14-like dessication related protein